MKRPTWLDPGLVLLVVAAVVGVILLILHIAESHECGTRRCPAGALPTYVWANGAGCICVVRP